MTTTILSKIRDQDHLQVENLTTTALVTPATTDISATFLNPRASVRRQPLLSHCSLQSSDPDPFTTTHPRVWTGSSSWQSFHSAAHFYGSANAKQWIHNSCYSANAQHLSSALQNPDVIDESLRKEIKTRCILPPLSNLWCSGFGVIPKHDEGWQIIYHLSAPPSLNINDFIDPSKL